MALLDTSALIDLTRGRSSGRGRRLRQALRNLIDQEEILVTSRFNVAELLIGVQLADDPADERARVDVVLRGVPILEFDAAVAEGFSKIASRLRLDGEVIGDMDALIASVALVYGHPIITRNPRHFQRVPDLPVVTY